MISPHYIIHAVTLTVIGYFLHKELIRENLIGQDRIQSYKPHSGSYMKGTSEALRASEGETTNVEDKTFSSSVWCHGENITNRICQFRNLCFHPEANQFVFFAGQESLVENLPESDILSSVVELSSVANHNAHYFTFIPLPSSRVQEFPIKWIRSLSFALNRFKPDNMMHVLHDDILPLHHTLTLIANQVTKTGKFDAQLVFLEGWDAGEYTELYNLLTPHKPLFRQNLTEAQTVTCFRNIYLGLSKSTLWYQYGFIKPQGVLPDRTVTSREIHAAVRFFRSQLLINSNQFADKEYYVLLSRTETRLILNEEELSRRIASEIRVKVIHVSSETHSLSEMIALVSMATGILGMHGASMSLTMFLKPGSVVIELFPFGINPENYTPYKTLAELPGMGLVYRAWRNMYAENNVPHPDWTPSFGGILHLSHEEQIQILSEMEVSPHLCCSDPSWLFRIYQDTVVNIVEVLQLIIATRQDADQSVKRKTLPTIKTFPSEIRQLKCKSAVSGQGEVTLTVTWMEPWNVPYLTYSKLHYELLVRDEDGEDHVKYLVSNTELAIPTVNGERNVILWIQPVIDDKICGPFVYTADCHT